MISRHTLSHAARSLTMRSNRVLMSLTCTMDQMNPFLTPPPDPPPSLVPPEADAERTLPPAPASPSGVVRTVPDRVMPAARRRRISSCCWTSPSSRGFGGMGIGGGFGGAGVEPPPKHMGLVLPVKHVRNAEALHQVLLEINGGRGTPGDGDGAFGRAVYAHT